VVIFGASGNLAARKSLPALYNLAVDGLLQADFHLIGFGRKPVPDAESRTRPPPTSRSSPAASSAPTSGSASRTTPPTRPAVPRRPLKAYAPL
jgi:glucose-6-phosphate 1-dehydrogenase